MLINIQFLRFVAAFMVVLYHASTHVKAAGVEPGFLFIAAEAVGFAGVDVFFLISGFIMFYTTKDSAGAAEAWRFIRRRLARIFSGYWPFFFLAWAVFAWSRPSHVEGVNWLGSFLLLPVPLNELMLDVSWTLTYELYFYFLFAVLMFAGSVLRWRVMAVFLLLFLAWTLWRELVVDEFSPENFYAQGFAKLFYLSPFLAQFFAGAVLARFAGSGSQAWGWILLTAGVAGYAFGGWVNLSVYDGTIEFGYYSVIRVLLFGVPAAALLMGLVWLENHGRVAPRGLSLLFGGASYAIYLAHTPLQAVTMKLGLSQALADYSSAQVGAVFIVHSMIVVLLAAGWYRWAERPLYRAFRTALRA